MGSGYSKKRRTISPYQALPFHVDSILGQGGYSTVYHGIDLETKKSIAIKQTNISNALTSGGISFIFNELNVFQRIDSHEFIINLHYALRTHENCYLILDCCRGGDLRQILKTYSAFNEQAVIYVLGCIGSALHHIHRRGIIHRDIKPENISLDLWGRPRLIDFGISVMSSPDNPLPICRASSGTMSYLAPEVLAPGNCHSYQADFWSLGMVAYELFYCERLFENHCPLEYIHYSANHYGHMWSNLIKKKDNSGTFSSMESITSLDFLTYSQDVECSRPVDESGQPLYPFPKLPSENNDNSLPSSLVPSFPIHRPSFQEPLSEECISLLLGLLDVRIPYRLGAIQSFSAFIDHPAFHLHHFQASHLPFLQSPFSARSHHLLKTPFESSSIQIEPSSSSSSKSPKFSKDIEEKLSEFHYLSSKRVSLKRSGSKFTTNEITVDSMFSKITSR